MACVARGCLKAFGRSNEFIGESLYLTQRLLLVEAWGTPGPISSLARSTSHGSATTKATARQSRAASSAAPGLARTAVASLLRATSPFCHVNNGSHGNLKWLRFFSGYYAPRVLWRRNHPPPFLLETGAPPSAPPGPGEVTAAAPFTLAKQQRLLEQLAKEGVNIGGNIRSTRKLVFKGRVIRQLSARRVKHGGRNCTGQITVRHRGGGHQQRLRFVDWTRSRKDIWGTVLRIEHDPSHSVGIGLLQHDDGVLSYVPVSAVTRPGDRIITGEYAPVQPGCCLPLQRIPVGTIVYAIELKPGHGAQLARAAGAYATLLSKDSTSATLRLPSGEIRMLPLRCWACIGQAMQPAQQGGDLLAASKPPKLGKAGASRWRGWRPAVRGKAMNACKHPHGGGTSQKKIARPPVSAWGIQRTGYKTRAKGKPLGGIVRRKRSNKFMRLFGSATL